MRKVLKYKLELGHNAPLIPGGVLDGHTIAGQAGAQGLCQLWTAVDMDLPEQPVPIFLAATGEELPENSEYLGTVLLNGGALVFHAVLLKDVA
jgi:hypothetical protein